MVSCNAKTVNVDEVDSEVRASESEQKPQGWICDKLIDTVSQMVPPLLNFYAFPLDDRTQNLKDAR